jgi:hypothetical protein
MNDQQQQVDTEKPGKKKATEYFVNGESQTTTEKELEVRTILVNAGFKPAKDWILSRDKDGHEFKHLDKLVPIHKDERFTAKATGPAPVS